jgi:hypothetical protein
MKEEKVIHLVSKFSCVYDGNILEHWKDDYESVFVLLHPFYKVKSNSDPRYFDKLPDEKDEILANYDPVKWKDIINLSPKFRSISEIDIALKTGINAIKKEYQSKELETALNEFMESAKLIEPDEGVISEFIENLVLKALMKLGYNEVNVSDEFNEEVKLLELPKMLENFLIPSHGHVYDKEQSFFLTTHWDSHFTFLCGNKDFIEKVLKYTKLEGFYCNKETEVFWSFKGR